MSKNKRIKKVTSCGAITWRLQDGQLFLLLIKQFSHKGVWGIPKGHIYQGETFEECAKREVKEETGIDVALLERLPNATTNYKNKKYKNEKKTIVSYLAQQIGDQTPNACDPDCEVADVKWFDARELPQIHFYQQPIIKAAIQRLCTLLDLESSLFTTNASAEPTQAH